MYAYIRMHTCMYTYTYICIYVYTYRYTHIHVYVYTHVNIHIHTYVYICIHIHVYIHKYTEKYPAMEGVVYTLIENPLAVKNGKYECNVATQKSLCYKAR